MNVSRQSFLALARSVVVCWGLASVASAAPTIWTGPTITFTKVGNAVVQDQLTSNVALARASSQGMYNSLQESVAVGTSPKDTAWATSFTSGSQNIDAMNWSALTFTNWTTAYNNSPGNTAVGLNAVVHLITDDIYLNLKFTVFGNSTQGAPFTYQRSTPAPEPSGILLMLVGLVTMSAWTSIRLRHRLGNANLTNSLTG